MRILCIQYTIRYTGDNIDSRMRSANLFKLVDSLGIVATLIRMILEGQSPVCPLYLGGVCALLHPQNHVEVTLSLGHLSHVTRCCSLR